MTMHDIPMSSTAYSALSDARDFTMRALSAARAAEPQSDEAQLALIRVQAQLATALEQLTAIKTNARIS